MNPTVFVTGSTGFIGRQFLSLTPSSWTVRALTRQTPSSPHEVQGTLEDPDSYAEGLAGANAVVHLGALTGKAAPGAFTAINRDATAGLLKAAEAAGVERFVFVSTIAVHYPEHRRYPYGLSKKEAEALVEASPFRWTIVRPTIVTGPGSPIVASLSKLAGLPFTPLFGDGQTKVQPILAADVARALWAVLDDDSTAGKAIDLGGPDVVTFDDLMQRLRTQQGRSAEGLVHLPVGLTSFALGMVEPAMRPMLPVTAGQLYAFRYDSTAEPSPFLEQHRSSFAALDEQLGAP